MTPDLFSREEASDLGREDGQLGGERGVTITCGQEAGQFLLDQISEGTLKSETFADCCGRCALCSPSFA
jgi:hypothetical protein